MERELNKAGKSTGGLSSPMNGLREGNQPRHYSDTTHNYGNFFMPRNFPKKIREDVPEKLEITKDTMIGMCFIEGSKEEKQTLAEAIRKQSGISNADQVMNRVMQKLENGELSRKVELVVGEEFIPTGEVIEKELDSYTKLLHSGIMQVTEQGTLNLNQESSQESVLMKVKK